ncbi:YihY/virulence factor BrkB family protein [Luteolibacter yonseiensis]|uniref:YihY/virulence factor BrkB family protein n=1 Tax=Luteolibacter yonseiensis TaxID=1144680 RepID=A0A934R2F5_9BACT|nr:YihY/virulence factor BrkB family protein [Luteolibacter yonseiensis]MBK1815609.1 YihY/virulence factor BrkB family protein [Luteolibacter yonseiensis]
MEKRLPKILRFASRVLRDFFLRNHGLLLTAAVSHNMMLSLIPLSAVLMVVFSHFIDQALLLETIATEISLIAPGFAPTLTEVLEGFLKSRQLIGWVGLFSLFAFSSLAFRVMEDAMAIIFQRPLAPLKRKFWISALMPYLFIFIVAIGLIVITAVNAFIDAQNQRNFTFLSFDVLLHKHLNHLIYLTGLLGLVLLFTLFYKIMPVVKVSFKRALAGGLTATILWEMVRHLLVTYYTKISIVNMLYGSMATIVIVLLIMESVALILLLGAQVIADLQRSADAGLPWHEDPEPLPPHADQHFI